MEQREPRSWIGRMSRNIAAVDSVVIAFHTYLLAWAMATPVDSADGAFAQAMAVTLLSITVMTVALVRGEILPAGRWRASIYRIAIIVPIPVSYFEIATLMGASPQTLLDQQLWAIDRMLFGMPPAQWLVRFNNVSLNEWFAFWYQSYYLLLALGLFVPPLLDRGLRLQELMLGAAIVGTVGQAGYTLVPGLGPIATLEFAEPIAGGYWVETVRAMLREEAAMDVFPSVHTAMPVLFLLHAFRHRSCVPHRALWPLLAFLASNIVVATMLLRLHWGIDVIAGLALASVAHLLSLRMARPEPPRDAEGGAEGHERQPVWEPLFGWQRAAPVAEA